MSESNPPPGTAPLAIGRSTPGALARATRGSMALFFVNGATFATWGVHIPTIKARFGLTDAMLSLAMLAVAGGALLAMGPVGRWVTRVGSARAATASGLVFALATVAILAMPSFWWLLPALFFAAVVQIGLAGYLNAPMARLFPALRPPQFTDMSQLASAEFQGQWWLLGVLLVSHAFNYFLGEELPEAHGGGGVLI